MIPTKETFVYAIEQMELHQRLMHEADKLFKPFGDFAPRLDSGSLHLQALLRLLAEIMNDTGEYISGWLFEDTPYTVSWEEGGKPISVTISSPGELYDYLVKYCIPNRKEPHRQDEPDDGEADRN